MKTKTKSKKNKNLVKNISKELITVILLCDSPGYRMKSYGPLSLINIGSKKLIDIQISAIRNTFKNFELVLCLGFDSEKVCRYIKATYPKLNIRIVENQLYNSSNSCEGLRLSLNNICNDKVIICDGNLVFGNKSLLSLDITKCSTLIEINPYHTMEIGLNSNHNRIVEHFSYGAKNIWSEIIFLTGKDIIENLRRILVYYDSKTRFVFEAINELMGMNYQIKSINNKYPIIKINNIKTYHDIKDKEI